MTVVQVQPTKKRRGKLIALVSVLGGLVLVACALWAAELWARTQVHDYVTAQVREVLSLEPAQPVSVDIAGFSVLAQLATGTLERIDVGVTDVHLGELSGNVTLVAEGIPIDTSKPVKHVELELAVAEESVQSIAHTLSSNAIDNVELEGSEIRFTSKLSIFGFTVDVGVGVEPFVSNGQVGFTPTSVSLNGSRADISQLTETFGPVVEDLFSSRTVCVARYLPAALGVDAVEVRDDAFLVVTISADDRVMNESALQKPGWCPESGAR